MTLTSCETSPLNHPDLVKDASLAVLTLMHRPQHYAQAIDAVRSSVVAL